MARKASVTKEAEKAAVVEAKAAEEVATLPPVSEMVAAAGPMIYRLIPKVMGEIGAIGKNRKNQQQGFAYRGIDDVYNACSIPMAKYGIFTTVTIVDENHEVRQSGRGTDLFWVRLKVKVTFFAPDGSSIATDVIGEAMDSGDKAAGKAMSYAMKYAFFHVFCIPVDGMDPDAETHEVSSGSKPKYTPNPAPASKPVGAGETVKEAPKVKTPVLLTEDRLKQARDRLNAFEFGPDADKMKGAIVSYRTSEQITAETAKEFFMLYLKRLVAVSPANQVKHAAAEAAEIAKRDYITADDRTEIFNLIDERLKANESAAS